MKSHLGEKVQEIASYVLDPIHMADEDKSGDNVRDHTVAKP